VVDVAFGLPLEYAGGHGISLFEDDPPASNLQYGGPFLLRGFTITRLLQDDRHWSRHCTAQIPVLEYSTRVRYSDGVRDFKYK